MIFPYLGSPRLRSLRISNLPELPLPALAVFSPFMVLEILQKRASCTYAQPTCVGVGKGGMETESQLKKAFQNRLGGGRCLHLAEEMERMEAVVNSRC